MDKAEQIIFVGELVNSLRDKIVEEIIAGKIPENWDGIELRWLISDSALYTTRICPANKKRKAEYNNTVIVNNL
jgi:hypothetical protein